MALFVDIVYNKLLQFNNHTLDICFNSGNDPSAVFTSKMINDITPGMCVWQTVVLIIGIYHWSSSSRVLTIVNQSSEVRGQGGVGNNDQHDPSI